MPYSITVHRVVCAAHALRLPGGVVEPLHGHNWEVRVTVARDELDDTGFVIDFHDLERQLDSVLRPLHNAYLNDLPELEGVNPTAENLCRHIAMRLRLPASVVLESVEVTEAPGCIARFRPARP